MGRRGVILVGVILIVGIAGCIGGLGPSLSENETSPSASDESTDNTDLDGSLEIHTINVGQADATLIIAPSGETLLIDSGDWPDEGQTVIDYLDHHDVDRIDHLVATHLHADHIGGHAAIIDHYETEKDGIGAAWDSGVIHNSATFESYLDAVDAQDVTLYETEDGDEIFAADEHANATVLNPTLDPDQPEDPHSNSVTVLVEFGESTALFTGDAEGDVEQRLVDDHADVLDVDIYHAGHHGSTTSSTPSFLDAIGPQATIISAAYESQYDHPHDETLDEFADRDVATYWTAVHGTTVFESDGETWTVSTQADATTDPRELRDESEIDAEPTDDPEEQETLEAISTGPHAPPSTVPLPSPAPSRGGIA